MANSIKIFRFVQNYCRAIGIDNKCSAFNWKNLLFLVSEAQTIAALTAFLLLEAKSMLEIGTTCFAILSLTLPMAVFAIFLRNAKNFSKFIESCEKFIQKSK